MPNYIKRAVGVDAIRVKIALQAISKSFGNLPPWLSKAYNAGRVSFASDYMIIDSQRAEMSDWVVSGVLGELYPVTQDIFAATYDVAPQGPPLGSGAGTDPGNPDPGTGTNPPPSGGGVVA